MHPPQPRFHAAIAASALLLGLTTSAWAQDYTVDRVADRYQVPPAGATAIDLTEDDQVLVDLPFPFPYFGGETDSVWVFSNGAVQFPNGTKPGDPSTFSGKLPIQGNHSGMCAPYWTDLDPEAVKNVPMLRWTTGAAPNRVVTVSWEGLPATGAGGKATFQVQLFEGSGKIVFAYAPVVNASDWAPFDGEEDFLSIVLDAPRGADSRFILPDRSFTGGHPGTDFEMTPRSVVFDGQLVYDELVVDENGIGTSLLRDVPLSHVTVAIVLEDGSIPVIGAADDNGRFTIEGLGLDGKAAAGLAVLARSDVVTVVSDVSGEPILSPPLKKLDLSRNADLGSVSFSATQDPGGTYRSVLHVALTVRRVHQWVAARVETEVPALKVLVNSVAVPVTRYSPPKSAGGDDALLAVAGGPSFSSPFPELAGDEELAADDVWDKDVIARTYGRHVLGALADHPTGEPNEEFDVMTNPENAFAVAFGHYLAAAVSGSATFVDGLDAKTALAIDLETPTFDNVGGQSHAGRVAVSLYDLIDPANETHDRVDGVDDPAAPLRTVESMTAPVTATSFLTAYGGVYEGAGLSRIYVHHVVVADDDMELNDEGDEAVLIGADGTRVDDRILNVFNEDWFEVDLGEDGALTVSVFSDQAALPQLSIEIWDGEELLSASSEKQQDGAVRATTGPLPAGRYRARVVHIEGPRLASYTVQAYRPLFVDQTPLSDWTVGRPFEQAVDLGGGVPPLALAPLVIEDLPLGLILDDDETRVFGSPLEAGTFAFVFRAADSGRPGNVAFAQHEMTINPPVAFALADFLGLPLGRAHAFEIEDVGGTAPYHFTVDAGQAPAGIVVEEGRLSLHGTAAAFGSSDLTLSGEDLAGSTWTDSTRVVVCAPVEGKKTPAALAAGDAATGYFVDALAGSTLDFTFGTAKKRAKRLLLPPVILAPDGAVVGGGKLKGGKGKATARKVVLPTTGRYFVVTEGDGEETELVGTAKLAAFKKSRVKKLEFGDGATLDLEFGAHAGARLTFKAVVDRKSGLEIDVAWLVDPDGVIVLVTDLVVHKNNGLSLAVELSKTGTWTLVLDSEIGPTGRLDYRLKVKQPKGASFSAD